MKKIKRKKGLNEKGRKEKRTDTLQLIKKVLNISKIYFYYI